MLTTQSSFGKARHHHHHRMVSLQQTSPADDLIAIRQYAKALDNLFFLCGEMGYLQTQLSDHAVKMVRMFGEITITIADTFSFNSVIETAEFLAAL